MRQWRLIVDSPMMGAYNMAIDEAIMLAVSDGNALPTLRLYDWSPLCLSLGYGQRLRDADLDRIDTAGWQIVRRPTGGKAILHGNELTYSVSIPKEHELAQGDVVESYRRISEALLTALRYLGLSPASEMQAKGNSGLGPVCFEVPSHYEITSGGKKLIGSAQVRRKDGILQHGTLPLSGDIALICEALVYPDDAARKEAKKLVRERATNLEAVLAKTISWETAAESFVHGFVDTFGLQFEEASLSADELATADELLRDRYVHAAWMNKR